MYRKIMIVDDSKVSRMIVKKTILEISPDMEIIEAGDGNQAMESLARNEIEAAILDFHMPGLNGLELAEMLLKINPDLPITMLTANIQHEIQERAESLGIGYLAKPAKKDELEAFVTG